MRSSAVALDEALAHQRAPVREEAHGERLVLDGCTTDTVTAASPGHGKVGTAAKIFQPLPESELDAWEGK
jgi:hypothetical protein